VFDVAAGAPVARDVLLGLEAFADLFLWGVGRGFFGKRDHLVRADEQVRAQDFLRRAELEVKKWSFAFEQARAPMCIESVDGKHLATNRAYADLHGYSADQLRERPVSDLLSEADRAGLARWVGEANASGHVAFEHRRMTRHGIEFPALVDITAIRNEEGDPEYRFVTVQDLTAVRATETALRQRAAEVRSSNEDLLRFAYAASHDLAEPLRAVRGFAQLLQSEYHDELDANGQRFVGHIVAGAQRMQELISDLLAYSRAGRLEVERTSVETERLFDEAIAKLSKVIEQTGAEVTHEGLPTIVAPRAINHVFFHLLTNALTFQTEEKPKIHVSATERDGAWEFAMRDNGIGIAEEYWDRVFGAFERLHSRAEYPGSGIGLAIVKRIVEQAGGRVRVQSVLGEGSTFYFSLPREGEKGSQVTGDR
jgi:PAS domain S-box-containing protein